MRKIANERREISSNAASTGQPGIRNETRDAIRARGVRSSTPGTAASRPATAEARAVPRRWTQSSPTYIESQARLRAIPATSGRL